MIEKEFIPYEEALTLKELGFDEPCFGYYNTMGFNRNFNIKNSDNLIESEHIKGNWCTAQTYSQAFRFFREKGYDVNIQREYEGVYFGFYWSGIAWIIVGEGTYEEAELACLRKLIELQGGNTMSNKQSSVADENYDYVKSNAKTLTKLKKIYGDCATDKTATFQVPKTKQNEQQ